MLDLELFEKVHVLILKCLFGVMLFLIENIVVYIFDLQMAVRKCPVTFLPAEFTFYPFIVIDEIGRVVFHIAQGQKAPWKAEAQQTHGHDRKHH